MSTTPDDGGPVFGSSVPAHTVISPRGEVVPQPPQVTYGLTLRDWFAGQALAGMVANSLYLSVAASETGKIVQTVAHNAYEIADSMLEARQARKSP